MSAKTVDPGRPVFKMECRFSVPMTTIYSKNSQIVLTKRLLGSSEVIQPKKQLYFAKGHLAPDSDFVYASQQDATYYFINAVPQWQAFNNGNWKSMEFSIRDLAIAHNSTLTVWTGTWGTLTLKDANNNDVPIYLGETVGKKLVPVPRLMWKVILEEDTGRAVALVGLNNPHATKLEKADKLCADICDQVSWVDWRRENFAGGYMYCCRPGDLHLRVPHAPALTNATLLSE
ncbi:salivary endonuclease-like [Oratosquilla oratoria]|uniref:salivary endonuclease-like n=1 Tax=Oratosquilla oratoria TaxID=337810 RepID=UPI003F765C88